MVSVSMPPTKGTAAPHQRHSRPPPCALQVGILNIPTPRMLAQGGRGSQALFPRLSEWNPPTAGMRETEEVGQGGEGEGDYQGAL